MAWFEPAQSFATGWSPGPTLQSAPIGTLVGDILKDRLLREKMLQEGMAETIKNIRQERQSDAYLDQLRAANLLPEGGIGGAYGAKYGHDVASLLLQKQQEERQKAQQGYMEPYYKALTKRANQAADFYDVDPNQLPQDVPEPYTDDQGHVWIPKKDLRSGRTKYELAPEWMQPKTEKPLTPAAVKTALANLNLTSEDIEAHERHHGYGPGGVEAPWETATDIEIEAASGGKPRLKKEELERMKRGLGLSTGGVGATPSPSPSANPDVTVGPLTRPTPPPADQNLAPGYGVPPGGVGSLESGKSRRMVGGKWWVWMGDPEAGGQGWVVE